MSLPLSMVTVLTVTDLQPRELALWIDEHILSDKVPVYEDRLPDIKEEVIPLLGKFANHSAFVTSLFNVVSAAAASAKSLAKAMIPVLGKDNEHAREKERLEASKEILYRTIQTLDTLYQATSRSMSGYDTFMSVNKRVHY